MTSDLSNAQKQVLQSLAKTVGSLHKRQWIDDEKKQHYRNILKSMSTRETYNDDIIQRLQKKLDRLKQKHVSNMNSVRDETTKQTIHYHDHSQQKQQQEKQKQRQQQIENGVQKTSRLALHSLDEIHDSKNNKDKQKKQRKNTKHQTSYLLKDTENGKENNIQKDSTTTRVRIEDVAHENHNEKTLKNVKVTKQPQHLEQNTISHQLGTNTNTHHHHHHASLLKRSTFHSNQNSQDGILIHKKEQQPTLQALPSMNHERKDPQDKMTFGTLQKTTTLPPIITNPTTLQGKLSHDETKHMFIEMCAFARLQFVQPPSCLRCTLSKRVASIKYNPAHPFHSQVKHNRGICTNYVVWRKDANLKIHPQNMNENVLFVNCATAQALLRGEKINGCKWNTEERVFEECCAS